MNTRQLIAIVGLLIALSVIAAGLAYIAPSPRDTAPVEDTIITQARAALDLTSAAHITIEAEERDYYVLGVYPNGVEGGGYIAIVHETPSGVQVIAQGVEAPSCDAVDSANVPVELITHCMTDDGTLIERALD